MEVSFRLKKWMYNLSIIKVPKPEAKTAVSNSGVSKENHPKAENVTLTYTQYGSGKTLSEAINMPPKKRFFLDFLTKLSGIALRVSLAIKRK